MRAPRCAAAKRRLARAFTSLFASVSLARSPALERETAALSLPRRPWLAAEFLVPGWLAEGRHRAHSFSACETRRPHSVISVGGNTNAWHIQAPSCTHNLIERARLGYLRGYEVVVVVLHEQC